MWPVVRSGVRLAGTDAVLLRLLAAGAATGVALAVVELVTPAWLGDLTEEPTSAALVYGALVALGFGADALGGAGSVRLRDRTGSSLGAAVVAGLLATAATGLLTLATALTGALAHALAGAAYLLVFAGLGAAGPLLSELLHGRVADEQRATVLSVESLLIQATGAAGGLGAGALVTVYGASAGLAVAVAALALGVLVLVRTTRVLRPADRFTDVAKCR